MRPIHHVIISGGVTFVFSIWVKSTWALAACFLSGIFIDLDHHLDYYLARKEVPLNYRKFVDFFKHERRAKLYLFLHAYELLFILWVSIFAFSLGNVWLGVALGFTTHIICDEIFNPFKPLAYFMTYRIKHKFSREALYKRNTIDGKSRR